MTLPDSPQPFWKTKSMSEMSPEEWESLCDGCAQCCLIRLEDEDTGEIATTYVVCRYLDLHACRCRVYKRRTRLVPTCLQITPELIPQLSWMPKTCAYRLIYEGKDLPSWHPLVSGNRQSVHRAGMSVRGRVVPESVVNEENLEDYITDEWDDPCPES